jgi:NAD(P)-dependent dehydrogenase (short-subunit alcohol dehydrogenase family)
MTDKKVAIVTGSGRGIGYAIARQLGRDGYAVVLMDIGEQERYTEALAALAAEGIDYTYIKGDISTAEGRTATVEGAMAAYGRIDVLVNNAGVAPLVRADLLEMTEESFDRVVGINTKGNMFLTQLVARQMITQQPDDTGCRGVIVNISSCSAEVSSVSRGEYCVSKAGVSMLTQLYADRLAGEGVLVHEIRPGVIATDMTSTVHAKYDKMIADGVFPIRRWGYPEDIANVVSHLCAPGAYRYTTGDVIDVDGGFHIRRL